MNRLHAFILSAGAATVLIPSFAGALTVEEGDTLSELTAKHYGSADWSLVEAVAYHNAIADPNLILVGQEIDFPDRPRRVEVPEAAPEPAVEAEHEPGTDWDGDGVIEPEPGEESIAIETEAADDFTGTYENLGGSCSEWSGPALAAGWSADQWSSMLNWIMERESGCNPGAYNPSGASGLLQLMPFWAAECGGGDLFDPYFNLACGLHVYHTQGWSAWDVV